MKINDNFLILAKVSLLSLSVALAMGCSSDSDSAEDTATDTATDTVTQLDSTDLVSSEELENAEKDAKVAAVKETLSGVTLSSIIVSDPYAECNSVTVGEKKALATGTPGKYTFTGELSTTNEDGTVTHKPVGAIDCVDSITGAEIADMQSDNHADGGDGADSSTVTPITTMVSIAKEQLKAETEATGQTLSDEELNQQAEASIAAMTGIAIEDLKKDPVTNPSVQKAAAKIVTILEIVKQSVQQAKTDSGIDDATATTETKAAMNDVFKKMIQEAVTEQKNAELTGTTARSLDDKLTDTTFMEKIVPAEVQAKASTFSATASVIKEAVEATDDEEGTGDAATDAVNVAKKVAAVVIKVKSDVASGVASGAITADNVQTTAKQTVDDAVTNSENILSEAGKSEAIVIVESVVTLEEIGDEVLQQLAENLDEFIDDEQLLEQATTSTTNAATNAANTLLQTACEARGGIFDTATRTCAVVTGAGN
ncbi:hypothetical protein D5085_02190 [Ectothiorhodospiraceae bacterium BW-2]|nr:hypothetical protein D5085_02190 [Ectothiorhodospiraceae bacterium BW-2]